MFAGGCEFTSSWKTTGLTSNQKFSRVNEAKLELGLTLWTLHDQPSFRINLGIFLLGWIGIHKTESTAPTWDKVPHFLQAPALYLGAE